MFKHLALIGAVALATAVTTVVERNPAHANPVGSAEFSCRNVEHMMMQAHAMMPKSGSMTGDIDKDFAVTEYQVAKAQVVIGHVVAKCGKTAANREAALEMEREGEARMRLFRNQGTSL